MLRFLSRSSIRRKRVLLRVDFNVPIEKGVVRDDFRIRAVLPTIRRLLRAGNHILLFSHMDDSHQTLAPVARRVGKLLGEPVGFIKTPSAAAGEKAWRSSRVVLFENVRRWPGETACSVVFTRELARMGDIYVNDAFGAAHRSGASLTILPKLLPSYVGLLLERELQELRSVIERPQRPLIAVLGGAKIGTKLPLLVRMCRIADRVLVGGAIANTLLAARGIRVGKSPVESQMHPTIQKIARAKKLLIPEDVVIASSRAGSHGNIRAVDAVGDGEWIFDIGPETQKIFREALYGARTVVWNGPLGLSEREAFSKGTAAIARAIAKSRARVIIGGGDTIAFLERSRLVVPRFYLSTGGGAMLAFLSGEKLPALEALRKAHQ